MSSGNIYRLLEETDDNLQIQGEYSGSEAEEIEEDKDCDGDIEIVVDEIENDIDENCQVPDEEFFIKRIWKKTKGKKQLLDEFRWAKRSLRSKYAKTPRKNLLIKMFPGPTQKSFQIISVLFQKSSILT